MRLNPAYRSHTYDANGNVGQLIDTTGAIVAHYEYGPFGQTLTITKDDGLGNMVTATVGDFALEQPFRFSTKYTDNETDLLYYGYRYQILPTPPN